MTKLLPVTAVIPTANRRKVLQATLESIAGQQYQPQEIIIVDASENAADSTDAFIAIPGLLSTIHYHKAIQKGAAIQRNQGIAAAQQSVIFFMDDDIILEPGCIERLWNGLQANSNTGAVNAMITNQRYHSPGSFTRLMYRLMSGENRASYAGKCIGPAWNLLPEDRDDLPATNEVEWLNTTCTLYRKEALPNPAFPIHFQDYSLLEDVALSLNVAKKWKLFNVRNARIFHDSQPGAHKKNIRKLAKMELVNRHYVMTKIMNRNKFSHYCKLLIFELFGMLSVLTTLQGWRSLIPVTAGKCAAIAELVFKKTNHE